MKVQANISTAKKNKKPFIQNGKKDAFVQANVLKKINIQRSSTQENKANQFAQSAIETPEIIRSYVNNNPLQNANPQTINNDNTTGYFLPQSLLSAFKTHLGKDFSDVQIHDDEASTQAAVEHHAAAFTVDNHIFLNQNIFSSNLLEGLMILSHELFHTIESNQSTANSHIQLKPLTELNDRSQEENNALSRAARIAQGEKGKVNSADLNEDQTRVGWELLLEYFKTTLGEDTIVHDRADYKAGKFLEENIKYIKKGRKQVVKIIDGKPTVSTENNVDLLPSWCGIFIFWALHKAGIHPPKWELGKPNFTADDQYKKGEYFPRIGDIVIKNGYNHHALVIKVEPLNITDTRELANVKVTTINGNTLGSNHQGGQIQERTDPYSYWDYYVNPFFRGVTLTDEANYHVDERLRERISETTTQNATTNDNTGNLNVNEYHTSIESIGSLDITSTTTEIQQVQPVEDAANVAAAAQEAMANDTEFQSINTSLSNNASHQQEHQTPEEKAEEAQSASVSPGNEAMSEAKANKVEELGNLPPPPKFKASELKANILKEVDKLLKEKEEEANETGDKPKIKDNEINDVKNVNKDDIANKKEESVGPIEDAQKEAPDENSVEKRENTPEIVEDAGVAKKIPDTSRAVAKPIPDERITLEAESSKIDTEMASKNVDEQQLAESEEDQFTGPLKEKNDSQAKAASVKDDYKKIEEEKLDKDKIAAKQTVNNNIEKIHDVRESQFGNVNSVKHNTKTADELKRKEIADKIEGIYAATEKSVNEKLDALEATVNTQFDNIMTLANDHFKENVNEGLDDEFISEFVAKHLDRSDYNRRVKKVFVRESKKYTEELSQSLDPLTEKIAKTLNATVDEIQAGKTAVMDYVKGLDPSLQEIGTQSATAVLDKFNSLEAAVNEKQDALTKGLAKKYADGVSGLEKQFNEIMNSRKSWLERALDAIVDAIKEIINLLSDLSKALERAASYAGRIIKSPRKFFNNLVAGATAGFRNFVSNIGKHLLQGALEWVTGEMSDAGIQLPATFDFKGILSIILQILGISVANVKEIAKKVIGEKYVNMLEKGVDIGMNVGEKIFKIFTIIKNEGIAGLWEFIKEQFNDLKEKMMEEAKAFITTTIVEVAVIKIASMLIPGAGFISAVKSLIDFIKTLFAKARQIVNIITGIIDTFGEILNGNVSKVSAMVENVLAKFLGMAITFLAAILGLGKVGKKINEIIQKKIKDPINKAIAKMMQKLKDVMTKLGIFKLMDKIDDKIKKGKAWVEDKKDKLKDKAKGFLSQIKNYVKSKFSKKYVEKDGAEHTLKFNDDLGIERHSVSRDLGNYLSEMNTYINDGDIFTAQEKKTYKPFLSNAKTEHGKIVKLIGKTVKENPQGEFEGADKYFSHGNGEKLAEHLRIIADNLRNLPSIDDKTKKNVIPKTIINYTQQAAGGDGKAADASLISLDSKFIGSSAESAKKDSALTKDLKSAIKSYKGSYNLVKGHLINHELFGTGNNIKNLGPIPINANNQMLNTFEEPAKNMVHSNKIISLYVEYDYQKPKVNISSINAKLGYTPAMSNIQQKTLKLTNDLNALGDIPSKVIYKLHEKQYTGASEDPEAKINDPANWSNKGSGKDSSFPINHDDFF